MGFNFRFTTKPSSESYAASDREEHDVPSQPSLVDTSLFSEKQEPSKPSKSKLSKERVTVVAASAVVLAIFSSYPSALPMGLVGEIAVKMGAGL